MKYLFGVINQEIDIGFKDIVRMLIENTGSFQRTSAYLSVVINDDTPFLFLNAYHHFLTKWEDADIADMIQLQFLDIKLGFVGWNYSNAIYCLMPET